MRTALFTGAGASRALGYPLTSELLPRVLEELGSGELFRGLPKRGLATDRRNLKKYLMKLLPGLGRIEADRLPLITDLFSLVEHAILNQEALPVGGEGDLRSCRDLLKQAITDILLGDFLEPYDRSNPEHRRQQRVLNQLTQWIRRQAASHGGEFCLITTNYDIAIEHEVYNTPTLGRDLAGLDLGFDWRDGGTNGKIHVRPERPRFRVYKLHGSLDLLRCTSCGYVYFNPFGTIAHQAFRTALDDLNTCHCRDDVRLDLHIVPPSLVREIRDPSLLNVWRAALEFLRLADRWIVVGYSMPPEDLAVRSLLIRAYAGRHQPPRITVVQNSDDALPRYRALFPKCGFQADGLEAFLERSAG